MWEDHQKDCNVRFLASEMVTAVSKTWKKRMKRTQENRSCELETVVDDAFSVRKPVGLSTMVAPSHSSELWPLEYESHGAASFPTDSER